MINRRQWKKRRTYLKQPRDSHCPTLGTVTGGGGGGTPLQKTLSRSREESVFFSTSHQEQIITHCRRRMSRWRSRYRPRCSPWSWCLCLHSRKCYRNLKIYTLGDATRQIQTTYSILGRTQSPQRRCPVGCKSQCSSRRSCLSCL